MRTATGRPGPAPAPRERAGPLLAHDHPPQPRGCGFALFPDAGSAPPRTPPSTLAHRLPEAGGAPGSAPLRGSAHLRPPAPHRLLDPSLTLIVRARSLRVHRVRARAPSAVPGGLTPFPSYRRAAATAQSSPLPAGPGREPHPGDEPRSGRPASPWEEGHDGGRGSARLGAAGAARPRGSGAKARVEHVRSAQTSLKPSHPAGRDSGSNQASRTSGASVVARPPRSPPSASAQNPGSGAPTSGVGGARPRTGHRPLSGSGFSEVE